MQHITFDISDGHPAAGPGWVYLWFVTGRVVYVGASWLHPAARAEAHLHAATQDPRSLALRKMVADNGDDMSVRAFTVDVDVCRQRAKAGVVTLCRELGLLATDFIDSPGKPSHLAEPSAAWLEVVRAELVAPPR